MWAPGARRQVSPVEGGSSSQYHIGSTTLPMSTWPQLVSLPASMSHLRGSPGRDSAMALLAAALSAQPMMRLSPVDGQAGVAVAVGLILVFLRKGYTE